MKLQTLFSIALVLFLSSTVLAQQDSVTATGFLTDTLCGAKGATASHVKHAKSIVASGKAKYAIYDEETRQLYILEPQETAVAYLGQRVTIAGTLRATAVRRAGQTLDNASQQAVSHSPRAGAPLDPSAALGTGTSTPVAGVLSVSSIATAPPPGDSQE
jgi:hypothetical protein